MALSPPAHPSGLPAYERMHVVGEAKSGKSTLWLSVARLSRITGSTRRFHVIDTDRAVPWMMGADDDNILPYPAYVWEEYLESGEKIAANVAPDDFFVVDLHSRAWDKVEEFYVRKTYPQYRNPVDFYVEMELEAKKANLSLNQYMMKWKLVNYGLCRKWFMSWLEPIVFRHPVHVILCSEVKKLYQPEGKPSSEQQRTIQDEWGRFGFAPEGHWQTGYFVHETVILQTDGHDGHYVTVRARDYGGRKRPEVSGMPFRDFATEVLMGKWGWTL